MANISSLLNTIKNAIYGRDMRSALHDAIKAVNDDTETRLKRSGGTMTGNISMGENKITSSATPSTDSDYTNKKYVDDAISSATMLDCEITDSDGGKLLDSDGQSIFGRVDVITAITNINSTLDKLKAHSILDSTF